MSCLCVITFFDIRLQSRSIKLFLTVMQMTLSGTASTNVDYNGKAAKSEVCRIMAYAHSGPMYLAFLFQRLAGHCAGESWFTDTSHGNGVITKTHAVYKYELQHHTDLVSLQVNLSYIAAQISPIRQSLMWAFQSHKECSRRRIQTKMINMMISGQTVESGMVLPPRQINWDWWPMTKESSLDGAVQ